ncbi:PE domain-containing protein [Mycobacterium innocens]|uniref:PE domain-containing protein n=1 Tax=Mycobacterium innocens TaxID=2341083 RepID=UPI0009E2021A
MMATAAADLEHIGAAVGSASAAAAGPTSSLAAAAADEVSAAIANLFGAYGREYCDRVDRQRHHRPAGGEHRRHQRRLERDVRGLLGAASDRGHRQRGPDLVAVLRPQPVPGRNLASRPTATRQVWSMRSAVRLRPTWDC